MPHRFQFSLKWLFVAMLVVAIGCEIWTKLAPLGKLLVALMAAAFIVEATAMAVLWITSKLIRRRL